MELRPSRALHNIVLTKMTVLLYHKLYPCPYLQVTPLPALKSA